MRAKEFLRQYEYALRAAERARQNYELEMERIDAIGSTLSGDGQPRGSGVSRKTEDKAIRLADKANEWLDAEERAQVVLEEMTEFINSIPGIEGRVLYARYISMLTWEQIAEDLYYSYTGVFYAHNRALDIVEKRLSQDE